MTVHSVAATVISTAIISASAATVVNHMVTSRWRRTRRRVGQLLGRGDDRTRRAVETELEAYAALVSDVRNTDDVALRRSVASVIESRINVVLNTYPDAVAELRGLLSELGMHAKPGSGGGPPDDDSERDVRSEPELERLGGLAWRHGDYDEAERDYQEAARLAHAGGDVIAEARARRNLGTTNEKLGHIEAARECFARAIQLYREVGDQHGEATAQTSLGGVLRRQGRYGEASGCLRAALDMHRDLDDRIGEATVLSALADVSRHDGDLLEALRTHRTALAIHRDLSNTESQSSCLNDCADTELELHRAPGALSDFAKALTIADRIDAANEQARAHDGIAKILSFDGDRLGAYAHWSRAWHLYRGLGSPLADDMAARMRELDR